MDRKTKALVAAALLGLSGGVWAHECQEPRFIELDKPFVGLFFAAEYSGQEFRPYGEWAAQATRWIAVDEILSVRRGDLVTRSRTWPGTVIKLRATALIHSLAQYNPARGTESESVWPQSVVFWLDGVPVADVMAAIRCIPAAAPVVEQAMTAEQRDRAEARRFQILQALEAATPADLL